MRDETAKAERAHDQENVGIDPSENSLSSEPRSNAQQFEAGERKPGCGRDESRIGRQCVCSGDQRERQACRGDRRYPGEGEAADLVAVQPSGKGGETGLLIFLAILEKQQPDMGYLPQEKEQADDREPWIKERPACSRPAYRRRDHADDCAGKEGKRCLFFEERIEAVVQADRHESERSSLQRA